MPRDKAAEVPNNNIGWKFANVVPRDRHNLNCKFCGRHITGGITRLKQHLAHMKGQITGCNNVSTEIRQEMMKDLLSNNEKKQREKQKQRDEVTTQVRASQWQYDDACDQIIVSSDDSDPKMTMAR
ncbi:hypothetical protein Vadar_030906 [Vaccinium darrowii]|uniref:Uncharacterized protein n=1 Tax=Vaccinium darrowii TaxID=229202 RepID=A0ACB7Z7V1_9ERIC|nr:hypothetical protein Vadar_030906 [Vaccinium darrowii]